MNKNLAMVSSVREDLSDSVGKTATTTRALRDHKEDAVSVEQLARKYLVLKADRDNLDEQLAEIGATLALNLDHPEEGSKTHALDGVKVTITSRVNRTLDERKWREIRSGVPKNLWPVKEKLAVEPKGCRYLAENHPEMWGIVAGAITEKPGKPGVKVEATE